MERYLLSYFFSTFVVGIACLGAVVILARRADDRVSRGFLLFYSALSVLVLGRLLLASMEIVGQAGPTTTFALSYMESFLGRYGVMFALPFFAHRIFGVDGGWRDAVLLAGVLAVATGQHVTEFALGEVWDDLGDVAEDVAFAGVMVYTLWTGIRRRSDPGVPQPLANRFLALLAISLPGAAYDLFLSDATPWRFYPLWYCALSVVLTATLFRRRFVPAPPIPGTWGLSAREEEVLDLVRRGWSNREIARELSISTNTVKTHLRAIFDKTGLRSRLRLVAALGRNPVPDPSDRVSWNHPHGRL